MKSNYTDRLIDIDSKVIVEGLGEAVVIEAIISKNNTITYGVKFGENPAKCRYHEARVRAVDNQDRE